jgi:uncharacterized protein YkwD
MRISSRALLAVVAIAAAVSLQATTAFASPRAPAAALSQLESSVLVDINAFRAQHGLARLRLNTQLSSAAQAHTQEMARDGYFAHESADGSVFWKRVQTYYRSTPWHYWSVGENLLWSSPGVDGKGALKLWLASPEHRANLMNPHWREIGVAAVHEVRAPGVYRGLAVTIVTTDFGFRR